jgi:hypothetical protein
MHRSLVEHIIGAALMSSLVLLRGRGGLDLDLPDRMMATLRAVLLPGGIVLE